MPVLCFSNVFAFLKSYWNQHPLTSKKVSNGMSNLTGVTGRGLSWKAPRFNTEKSVAHPIAQMDVVLPRRPALKDSVVEIKSPFTCNVPELSEKKKNVFVKRHLRILP